MYVPPGACSSNCPPSPTPPAGAGPNTNVFSLAPNVVAPIVKLPVINTFWFNVFTDDAVDVNDALTACKTYDAVCAVCTNDAVKALVAHDAVPNNEPV